MSTFTRTTVSTSEEVSNANIERQEADRPADGTTPPSFWNKLPRIGDQKQKNYHVFPTHSISRPSCLSRDAEKTPSFVGFRNLMIIVLGAHSSQTRYKQRTDMQYPSRL